MQPSPYKMSVVSNRVALPPSSPWTPVLAAQSSQATPRIIDVASVDRKTLLPATLEVEIVWSNAGPSLPALVCTVTTAARLTVVASSVQVRARNLSYLGQTSVAVNIADGGPGYGGGLQYQATGAVANPAVATVYVPDWATHLHLSLSDPAQRTTTFVLCYDSNGHLWSRVAVADLPPEGLPMAGVAIVEVDPGAGSVEFRAIFKLAI